MVYRGYYYEKNLCVMITHYNVFRRFFRIVYIIAIIYEQNMNLPLTFVHLHNQFYFLYFFLGNYHIYFIFAIPCACTCCISPSRSYVRIRRIFFL